MLFESQFEFLSKNDRQVSLRKKIRTNLFSLCAHVCWLGGGSEEKKMLETCIALIGKCQVQTGASSFLSSPALSFWEGEGGNGVWPHFPRIPSSSSSHSLFLPLSSFLWGRLGGLRGQEN